MGYELLGIVVKKVTGITYSDILVERVFKPLNMQTARLISDRDIVMNRAAGYTLEKAGLQNQNWVSPSANATADGSLYLTVLDFAKWDEGLQTGRILKSDSWAEVYRPVKLSSGSTYPYGFGWFLEESNGQVIHQHGGAWQGFRTSFIRYLTDGVSIVVLDNLAGSDPERIARHVAGLYKATLALPLAFPANDSEPQVSSRTKELLERVIAGTAKQQELGSFWRNAPRSVFENAMGGYRDELGSCGPIKEFRLFQVRSLGDDRHYIYRIRFENNSLKELRIDFQRDGSVSSFFLSQIPSWDAPLPP